MAPCHVCEGRETIETVLRLQLAAEETADLPPSIPLCPKHFTEAEDALAEVRKIQSPPVHIRPAGAAGGWRRRAMIIVTGLPRSGTSLMMAMLEAGGVPCLYDRPGRQEGKNEHGYYELDEVMYRTDWTARAAGVAVKVVNEYLDLLPKDLDAKFLVCRRHGLEVAASRGRSVQSVRGDVRDLYRRLDGREFFEVWYHVWYSGEHRQAKEVAGFLGLTLDLNAMLSVIDPTLWHHRA